MAVIEIRTDAGEVIDTINVNEITEPLQNGRVWALAQSTLGTLIIRRVEMAHAVEMGHPKGSRTRFVEAEESACLTTGRDRERLDGKAV